jgi:hypothetical protein
MECRDSEDLDREFGRVLDDNGAILTSHGHFVLADVAENLVMDAVAPIRRLERAGIGGQRKHDGEDPGIAAP